MTPPTLHAARPTPSIPNPPLAFTAAAAAAFLFLACDTTQQQAELATAGEIAAASISVSQADWPWWRGAGRDGVAQADQQPPLRWSETDGVLWKAAVPGRGHSSPTVIGERVLLATADEKEEVQSVLCYDRATGREQWKVDVHRGKLDRRGHQKTSQASSTVATDGQRLFVNFLNDGAVFTTALDLDGNRLWQTRVSDFNTHQGFGSSPAVYEALVIVATDSRAGGLVAALHRETGQVVWKQPRPKLPNYTSPTILRAAGRDQVLLAGCDLVSSFDPLTGKKLWEIAGSTTECVGTMVTDGQLVFASGGYPQKLTLAVRADGSGEIVWQNNVQTYVPSMLVVDGYLYTVTDGGIATCWEARTGREAWKARLGGTFNASPVLVGGHIYATNQEGKTFIFEADPQQHRPVAENQLGEDVYATPVIAAGRIYLRVAHRTGAGREEWLYCIGEEE